MDYPIKSGNDENRDNDRTCTRLNLPREYSYFMSKDSEHPLIKLLKNWGEDITREFERAALKGGTKSPSDIADFRENAVGDFLSTFFPFPYRITKGVIRDYKGRESASIDRVILAPNHPNTIHKADKASLILADGVEAAVEIKSDPSALSEIKAFVKQSQKTKLIRRKKDNNFDFLLKNKKKLNDNQIATFKEFCREIPYFVFFEKSEIDLGKCLNKIYKTIETIQIRELPDFIVLNGNGIIVIEKVANVYGYNKPGIYFEYWQENTIPGFLLFLNNIHSAQMQISEPIMNHYLPEIRKNILRMDFSQKDKWMPLMLIHEVEKKVSPIN